MAKEKCNECGIDVIPMVDSCKVSVQNANGEHEYYLCNDCFNALINAENSVVIEEEDFTMKKKTIEISKCNECKYSKMGFSRVEKRERYDLYELHCWCELSNRKIDHYHFIPKGPDVTMVQAEIPEWCELKNAGEEK